jgi:hypothetical protein
MMTKRQMRIGAVIMILIVIGIVVDLRHGSAPTTPAAHIDSDGIAATSKEVNPPANASAATSKSPPVGEMWTRPAAKVAARNLRRVRFAELRRLGATEKLVDRLANGDALAVLTELKQQALRGDPVAGNILAYTVHLCNFASPNIQEAQALPVQDAEWLNEAMQEKIAYNKQFLAACLQAIDQKEVMGWVTQSANQGDGASLWLLSWLGADNPVIRQSKLLEAVAAAYPEAQSMLAGLIIHPAPYGNMNSTENAGDLLRAAAVELPYAEGQLAICEFSGCPGIDLNIPSAVTHAREAAQRGSFDAMLEIGPQLQASQIGADQVAAWILVYAALAQQGCVDHAINAQSRRSVSFTLNSSGTASSAKSLAENYWQDYAAQILSNLGCTS